jgi:hypothetical protein
MNAFFRLIAGALGRFFGSPVCRALLYLALLCLFTFLDYRAAALTRLTFVFYGIEGGGGLVEERMLPLSGDQEKKLGFYVKEALLGPASQEALPLFPRDTRLESLLFRDGVVYLDLSETAILPVEGEGCFRNLSALRAGIMRNFGFVKDIRLFVVGSEVFPDQFRKAD